MESDRERLRQQMTIKPDAVAWLASHFDVTSPLTYTSKYYIPEKSRTRRAAWWIGIPRSAIATPRAAEVHLVLQVAPDAKAFHYLCVPTSFLNKHLAKLKLQPEDRVSLFLSAEPHNMFVDQRGKAQVTFRQFLKTYDDMSIKVYGGGYPDQETRQKVAAAAIKFVTAWLTSQGYEVTNREPENCGYDLLAISAQRNLKVEVKGTDASKPRFFLTRNEWGSRADAEWRLAIVTSARSVPTLTLLTGDEVARQFSFEALAWECKRRDS